jgi:2-C-methyl-D-erythritol 2,4-cyclodiphosphate synthase
MQQTLAEVMGVDVSHVNVKATTTEHLGFVGRKEGIAAYAIALLT